MIRCEHIEKRFPAAGGELTALTDVSLTVDRGEFVAVKGPSGCGKTTLLLALGGMQRPTAGRVWFGDTDLYAATATERNRIRAGHIGFVFQLFHLVPYLTVRENILVGLAESGEGATRGDVDRLIAELGLEGRALEKPGTLSAGERQRVALARALIKQPELILADEPTGNLDPDNASEVFRHLANYRRSGGTVIVVTHGPAAESHATRTIAMKAGRIISPDTEPSRTEPAEHSQPIESQ